MPHNQEEVRKQFDRMPPIVKQAIANLDMGNITDNLRKKYNLHVDQVGRIAEEITATMVGLTKPAEFGPNIKAQTGLSEDIVNLITYDLNQQIFSKIRKELEELSQNQNPIKASPVPQPSLPTDKVFTEKMTTVANIPKQEVAVMPETSDNKVRDPYLEPI